jgi:hypothetical protein
MYPYPISAGEVVTLDLTGLDATEGVRICWGPLNSAGDPTPRPALVVQAYWATSPTSGDIRMFQKNYDPTAAPRDGMSWANQTNGDCNTGTFLRYFVTIRFNNTGIGRETMLFSPVATAVPLFMRVRMVYNNSVAYRIAFAPAGGATQLPLQAGSVEASGVSGDSVQRLKAVVPNYDIPGVFDGAIFSGTGLSKAP